MSHSKGSNNTLRQNDIIMNRYAPHENCLINFLYIFVVVDVVVRFFFSHSIFSSALRTSQGIITVLSGAISAVSVAWFHFQGCTDIIIITTTMSLA